MGIAYKELHRVNRPLCGPGPGVFSLKDTRKAAAVRLNYLI